MEKSIIADAFNSPDMFLKSDETHRQARLAFLADHIQKLESIAQQLDSSKMPSEDQIQVLNSIQIYDCSDPFQVTNQLVVMLESAIEEQRLLQGKDLA